MKNHKTSYDIRAVDIPLIEPSGEVMRIEYNKTLERVRVSGMQVDGSGYTQMFVIDADSAKRVAENLDLLLSKDV